MTRRIARLESAGVIRGYTAVIDRAHLAARIEAITEVRFVGDRDTASSADRPTALPEVTEVTTIAGETDALVRLRVTDVRHLQRVVDQLRRNGDVVTTKTHISS